jgi:hypothetical protein
LSRLGFQACATIPSSYILFKCEEKRNFCSETDFLENIKKLFTTEVKNMSNNHKIKELSEIFNATSKKIVNPKLFDLVLGLVFKYHVLCICSLSNSSLCEYYNF